MAIATAASAGVAPGDGITADDVERVHDLVSPGLEWVIRRGWPITVREPRRVEWPKAYREATEQYASQVKLSADGLTVENYVAGQPFPHVDAKDPRAAYKIMWNYNYGCVTTDDVDLRNFDADTGPIADHGPLQVERHFLLDHFRRLFWTGRLYVDPKPEKPNPHGYRVQQGLYPILEPFDLKGVGALSNRYIERREAGRHVALPAVAPPRAPPFDRAALRRALRPGHRRQTATADTPARSPGWTGSSSARRRCSASFHATNYPGEVGTARSTGRSTSAWEKRKVWVVEGESKLPQYAFSKRVIFVDKESVDDPVHRHLRPRRASSGRSGSTTSACAKGRGSARSSTPTRWAS